MSRSIVNKRFNCTPQSTFVGMAMLFAPPSQGPTSGSPGCAHRLGEAKSMAIPAKVDRGVQLNRIFTIDRHTWLAGAIGTRPVGPPIYDRSAHVVEKPSIGSRRMLLGATDNRNRSPARRRRHCLEAQDHRKINTAGWSETENAPRKARRLKNSTQQNGGGLRKLRPFSRR